jgi:excinuclease ABC subunit A
LDLRLRPGAGLEGGNIVANGIPSKVMKAKDSVTGAYLSGRRSIKVPEKRHKPSKKWLTIKGAQHNNLSNIDVKLPLGCFTSVYWSFRIWQIFTYLRNPRAIPPTIPSQQ